MHANSRIIHGQWFYCLPSRFIDELPSENISSVSLKLSDSNYISRGFDTSDMSHNKFNSIEFNQQNESFRKGARVFHQKFGYGIVLSTEGNNAEVQFEKTNIKRVKIDFLINDA